MSENNQNETPSGGLSPVIIIFMISGLLGLLAAAGLLLSDSANQNTADPYNIQVSAPRPPIMDGPAPNFQLTSIHGDLVSLAQFRGRPVFVNLWWTGCPPCVREFPAFQQFMEEQGPDGAVVIAVNPVDTLDPVRRFVDDLGVHDVIVLLDPDRQVPRNFPHHSVFPATYLIDADGIVREFHVGEITLDEMYAFIEALQAEVGVG